VKGSERVYLEAYTSLLLVPKETLVRLLCSKFQSNAVHGLILLVTL